MGPDVSVVVPMYNVARYLPQVVKSLDEQTAYCGIWEAVFVDDCSTDGGLDLARKLTRNKRNMRVISREENGGLSAARNSGIEQSQGRFIAQLDGDDTLVPQAIDVLDRYLKVNSSTKYFYSSHQRVDGDGNNIGSRASEPFVHENFLHYNLIGPLKGYERDLNDKIGGFRNVYAEDWDHALRASEVLSPEEFGQIPESLYLYLIRDGSIVTGTQRDEKMKAVSSFLTPHIERFVGSPVRLFFSHITPNGYGYYDWEVKEDG